MKTAHVTLEYQNLIPGPPVSPTALMQQASANDLSTVEAWRDTWVAQTKANKAQVGSFAERSIGKLFNQFRHKPCIVAGSGPSLAGNGAQLKNRGEIPLISCLHNFHFFEDNGVPVDFYVSLDAGPVVLEEVSEGGVMSAEEYWARTEHTPLLCYIGSHPDLIKRWRGPIYFFNCIMPDPVTRQAIDAVERFNAVIGCGGNVLGACLYIAKAVFGCNPIAFTGADFCFGYDKRFHGWDSKYDKDIGECIPLTDIYGIKRKTWPSYAGFKSWFEHVACAAPGIYINCSEGGCLGSYPQGNIAQFAYMDLAAFLGMYLQNETVRTIFENPETPGPIPVLF